MSWALPGGLSARCYYLALQKREEQLWTGIPSPGEFVPLRLMARGFSQGTVIERVWTPLADGEELVYSARPSCAALWSEETRLRFAAPLQTLTQQLGQLLEVHARVEGPLEALLLLCVDRKSADHAARELPEVGYRLACARSS